MRSVYLSDLAKEQAFAEEAARHFATNPKNWTYSSGPISPGCFIGMRWGGGNDCVVVIKLDDFHMPTNYMELIKTHGSDTPRLAD